jgi:hypothetical protein
VRTGVCTRTCTRNIGYVEVSPEKSPSRHLSEQEVFLRAGDSPEDVFRERLHSHERHAPAPVRDIKALRDGKVVATTRR